MDDTGKGDELPTCEEIAVAAGAYVDAWELERSRGAALAALLFKRDVESVVYEGYVLKCKEYTYGIEAERHLRVF